MRYLASAVSVTGRVRKNNEDNFSLDSLCLPLSHGDSSSQSRSLNAAGLHLLGVYDGMGGYSDGEAASYIAAATAKGYLGRLQGQGDIPQILTDLCLEANDAVCKAADGSHMGTTCALLCLENGRYVICNIGDSPIFLLRGGALQQLSEDHNQKAMYEQVTGKPAPAGKKFKLTQCIGIPREEMLIEPFTASGAVQDGDIFLLCSDGITDMISPEGIRDILAAGETPEQITRALIDQAMAAGGRDNATAVCVRAQLERPQEDGAVSGPEKKGFLARLKDRLGSRLG